MLRKPPKGKVTYLSDFAQYLRVRRLARFEHRLIEFGLMPVIRPLVSQTVGAARPTLHFQLGATQF